MSVLNQTTTCLTNNFLETVMMGEPKFYLHQARNGRLAPIISDDKVIE
jgi:hypothetical protein